MGFTQKMTRRGRKGGRAVQLKRLKKQLYASGNFDPIKSFPKEIPAPIPTIPQIKASPHSKATPLPKTHFSSTPKSQSRPTAKDTFYPERILIRPRRSLSANQKFKRY